MQRRRWPTWFSMYWCFGSHKHDRRISHAVLVPEPMVPSSHTTIAENSNHHPPSLVLPFVAPPSSPVSLLQSEPPSASHSPAGPISFSPISGNSYSPTGPASIFAIGPYAHETQLVSPPAFSTFNTEPSTASFTPPPEPMHLTTPSSPEVPFAQLLSSSFSTSGRKGGEACEFNSYQLYPGSPIGHLISPSSVCSGTSSPFPDPEPPKILNAEEISRRKLTPRHSRNGGSLLDGRITAAASLVDLTVGSQNHEHGADHRVSFELTAEDVARCLGKKSAISGEHLKIATTTATDGVCTEKSVDNENCSDIPEKARSSLSLPVAKEFNFDNSDTANAEPSLGSDWWANEKVGRATEPRKDWAFFPMIQPGVS